MLPTCAALTVAVLGSGCGPKKVYPVIVRETVFVRDARGVTTPQQKNERAASPTSGTTTPERAIAPRPVRGVTGDLADLPAATGTAGLDSTPPGGSLTATPASSQSPGDTPADPAVADRPARADTPPRRSGLLMVLWFAVAAALCGWGVLLRRDSLGRHRAHRTRRAA